MTVTLEGNYRCPNCGLLSTDEPYNIGSGPELTCVNCDTCWGILGQPLDRWDTARQLTTRDELIILLREWYVLWEERGNPKVPRALHVRTGLALHLAGLVAEADALGIVAAPAPGDKLRAALQALHDHNGQECTGDCVLYETWRIPVPDGATEA